MAKQSFSVGQVLTAAQMTSLQQTAMLGGSTTAKTTSYTLVAADAGTVVSVNSTSATTITVNTGLFSAGDTVTIQNWGSGAVTITAGTATVNTSASLVLAQYQGGTLYFTSASASLFFKADGAAAASGDNWTLLNAGGTSLSANPTTITGISGANKIMVIVAGASGTSNADSSYIQFNGSGDYFYIGLAETWASTYAASNFSVENNMASSPGGIFYAKMSNTGGSTFGGAVTMTGCNASGVKAFQSVGGGNASGSTGQIHYVQQGVYTESASISSVSIKLSNGFATFDAGTVYVYTTA